MQQKSSLLGPISANEFLETYWQKKPCILRQVFSAEKSELLSVDDLAGFAVDETIESRLIIGNSADPSPTKKLTLQHGPFTVEALSQLPDNNWTLLIQSMNLWDEKFNALLDWVDFLPRWRLDDIMVSIAAPGGGVGPHRDQYDVFLLQTHGERHWQVSAPNQDEDILCGDELLQVPAFKGEIDEILSAGDVLYLPPGWRHWGVAKSLCVTTSIGFRAPSAEDLMLSLSDQLASVSTDRYSDAWRKSNSSESITQNDIQEVKQKISAILEDDYLLAEALGLQVTQPKIAIQLDDNVDASHVVDKILNRPNLNFSLHPISRMSYFEHNNKFSLFANGVTLNTKLDTDCKQFIEQLCKHHPCSLNGFNFNSHLNDLVLKMLKELHDLDALLLEE